MTTHGWAVRKKGWTTSGKTQIVHAKSPGNTYHLAQGKAKDTAKSTRQDGTGKEDGDALVDFLTAIP
jgi:hypothetical protein